MYKLFFICQLKAVPVNISQEGHLTVDPGGFNRSIDLPGIIPGLITAPANMTKPGLRSPVVLKVTIETGQLQ